MYNSKAPVIEGAFGSGASMSRINPASRTALAVVGPNAASRVLFCLKSGKFTEREFIPDGLKIGSNGVVNYPFRVIISAVSQKVWNIILANIRTWEEVLLVFVFLQNLQQILSSLQSGKNFP